LFTNKMLLRGGAVIRPVLLREKNTDDCK